MWWIFGTQTGLVARQRMIQKKNENNRYWSGWVNMSARKRRRVPFASLVTAWNRYFNQE
jgi:hypothetical protein